MCIRWSHTERHSAENIIIGDEDKGMAEGLRLGLTPLAPFDPLTPLAPFDPLSDPTSLGQCWKAWKCHYEAYIAALNITDAKRNWVVLLYQIGEAILSVFNTLLDTGSDYDTAMTKVDEYFSPKKNVHFEIFRFRTSTQKTGETIDQYATRLRMLAQNCEFFDVNHELKLTIIQNCLLKWLQRIALQDWSHARCTTC